MIQSKNNKKSISGDMKRKSGKFADSNKRSVKRDFG